MLTVPNPISTEQSFRSLKQSLSLLSNSRVKLLRIAEFVELFPSDGHGGHLIAYAPELYPLTSRELRQTDIRFTNPEFISRLERVVQALKFALIENVDRNDADEMLVHLAKEKEKIFEFTGERCQRNEEREKRKLNKSLPNLVESPSKAHRDKVLIPMVEREPMFSELKPCFASIREVQVEVQYSDKPSGEDQIIIDQTFDPDGRQHDQLQIALAAGKCLFRKLTRAKVTKRLSVRCSIEGVGMVIGDSIGGGLAAVILAELIRLQQFKREFALREDVAITGRIDEAGRLLPVDEEGLKLKVEAATFSSVRALIVPKEQEAFCRSYAEELEGGRDRIHSVAITGVSSLEEVFYDRRLTVSEQVHFVKRTRRKLWHHRRSLAVAMMVTLIAVIGKLLYGPLDRNPHQVMISRGIMLVENKHGEVLDEIKVDTLEVVPSALYDVNGDGINEIIWGQPATLGSAGIAYVCCKSVTADTLIWKVPLRRNLHFHVQPDIHVYDFFCRELKVGNLGTNPGGTVIATAVNPSFPCLVLALDAKNGKKLGAYIHVGHLNGPEFVDIDDDGIKEVLLAGVNQAYGQACLVVLDPRFISGHSPLHGDYKLDDCPPGLEKAYLRIPRTIVGEALARIAKYSVGRIVETRDSTDSFRLSVLDVHGTLSDLKATIYPLFGYDLRAITVTTGDDYDLVAKGLFEEGRIARYPDSQYFDEYKKTMLYWDGEAWKQKASLNRRYLEEVRNSE